VHDREWEQNRTVHECRHCANGVEDRFRYCPWCSLPQRTKLVEFFAPHPSVPLDVHKALRVSRYFGSPSEPPQLRFSIWHDDAADAAISLTDEEAARLAAFVAPVPPPRRPLIEQLRESFRLFSQA
jgi:hypothetical protein